MSAVAAQPTVKYVLTCLTIHADHAASGRSEFMYSWSASKWKTESGASLRVHASAKPVALSHGWNESAHGTGGMRLRQTILAAAATEKLPSASEKLHCPWSGLASRVGWPVLLLSEAPTSAVAIVVRELTRLAFIRVRRVVALAAAAKAVEPSEAEERAVGARAAVAREAVAQVVVAVMEAAGSAAAVRVVVALAAVAKAAMVMAVVAIEVSSATFQPEATIYYTGTAVAYPP